MLRSGGIRSSLLDIQTVFTSQARGGDLRCVAGGLDHVLTVYKFCRSGRCQPDLVGRIQPGVERQLLAAVETGVCGQQRVGHGAGQLCQRIGKFHAVFCCQARLLNNVAGLLGPHGIGDVVEVLHVDVDTGRGCHGSVGMVGIGVGEGQIVLAAVLHGKNGEDGTIQGLLELAGVPVIGCGALSSALCMDKDRSHKLAALAGVRVPRSAMFPHGTNADELQRAAQSLGYPLFVKPVRAGSSFGVSMVRAPEKLAEAAACAFANDRELLLEEAIPGFEVGCAVLGTESLTVGAVDEIELSQGFFDFEEKYTLKTSAIHCPARISAEKAAEIQQAAKTIYRALDCKGFARVDLFLTPEGEIIFNEVNTIPGFTAHSRYPNMMRAAGLDFTTLISRIIETGVNV